MRNTNLNAIHDFWERFLTVETIREPLQSISIDESCEKAVQIMEEKHFDILGVKDNNGNVIGYLDLKNIDNTKCVISGECLQRFEVSELVSLHTPLRDSLGRINSLGRVFVLGSKGVEGIVTFADLDKQPVRMLFFSLISLIEMGLSQLIKQKYPNGEWKDNISKGRIEKAQCLYEDRIRLDQDVDILACLQICDKSDILIKNNFWKIWNFSSKKESVKFFKILMNLRNSLAHSQDNIWCAIPDTFHNKAEEVMNISNKYLSSDDE